MKLEEQIYQIQYWKKIKTISHTELLWNNKQIIRLQWEIFNSAKNILNEWWRLSLYNHYNPINKDLIRKYIEKKYLNNWALIAKIIWNRNNQPILDWNKLQEIKVLKMENIFFENIKNEDLYKSLLKWDNITVEKLINWLSKEFYKWKYTPNQILKYQKLFFRQIKLK